MHHLQIETSDKAWIIPEADRSRKAQKRLVQIFDWVCGEANRREPRVAASAQLLDYIEDPLAAIRAGRATDRRTIDSRTVLESLIANPGVPTVEVGLWLLRSIAYLGDETRDYGRFHVPLPHAIALLSALIDREGDLITYGSNDGRAFIRSTRKGARAAGVPFTIGIPQMSAELMDCLGKDEPLISSWCAGEAV